MTGPRTPRLLLSVALGVLALTVPAASLAVETSTTTSGSTTPITTTSPAPPAEAPASTTTTDESTVTTSAPEEAVPLVEGQHSQGASAGPSRHKQAKPSGAGEAESGAEGEGEAEQVRAKHPAQAPSTLTPSLPLALRGSISGVPSFFIESFQIPPFLLPIFQAAGTAYGIPWQVLAAINEVETDYGRDLSVSSAGAEGWMQFLPSSWAQYGVDANGDGYADPYNPADAIFAAARYLRAAGAATNLRGAHFSYNHSQAYVESVTLRAKLLGGTPSGLLGAITGLTESRYPVHARSHFSDGFPTVAAGGSPATGSIAG